MCYYEENGLIYKNENKEVLVSFNPNFEFGEEIIIPNTVKKIQSHKVGEVAVPPRGFANFKAPKSTLIIPSSVEKIDDLSFYYAKLDKVIFEEGFKKIDSLAFSNSKINEFVLPKSLKSIGFRAFDYSNTKIINLENVEIIEQSAFSFSKIKYANLSENLKEIQQYAFNACKELKKIDYNTSCDIPGYAFHESGLRAVNIKTPIKKIGIGAFENCRDLKKVTLPNTLEVIESISFAGDWSLNSIFIPSSVKEIGTFAFNGSYLENIVIEEGGNLSLRNKCFANTAISQVVLPKSVTEIGDLVFECCRDLQKIEVYANAKAIPFGFARHCTGLTDVILADNITTLGKESFKNTGLKEIDNNFKNITDIEDNTFEKCIKLKNVILHSSLKQLGALAFKSCRKLENIFVLSNPTTDFNSFAKINKNAAIYAPFLDTAHFDADMLSKITKNKDLAEEMITSIFPFRKSSRIIEEIER